MMLALSSPAYANNRPVVEVSGPASVQSGNPVTISYTSNRGGKQLQSSGGLTCSLTGPATSSSCGSTTTAQGTTTGSVTFSNLPAGSYTYTVSIVLTDGGTASSSLSFSVTSQYAGQAVCTNLGGTFVPGGGNGIWACDNVYAASIDAYIQQFNALDNACAADGGPVFLTLTDGGAGDNSFSCGYF
jgi:serine protease